MTRHKNPSNQSPGEGQLLTIREVAQRLNVSERTVRRLISSRELEAYQIRRQWRISEHGLATYLALNRA